MATRIEYMSVSYIVGEVKPTNLRRLAIQGVAFVSGTDTLARLL